MIIPNDCYTNTYLAPQTTAQNETELVWPTIILNSYTKLVMDSFYRATITYMVMY